MSSKALKKQEVRLYDQDFQLWLEQQATFLQEKASELLDVENLVEELRGEVRAERTLATTTFRLLLLTHLLRHTEAPSKWWQPYLESLMMHFPNSLLPSKLFQTSELMITHPRQLHDTFDTDELKRGLQTLLEQQLSRSLSLAYYLNDRADEIFVEAVEVGAQVVEGSRVENEFWSALDNADKLERTLLNQLLPDDFPFTIPYFLDNSSGDETSSCNLDRYAWLKKQVALLSVHRLKRLDFSNLSREVSTIAKRDKHALESRLAVLLVHLLKHHYQPERRGSSWTLTIREQRSQIRQILEDSPSLRNSFFSTILDDIYVQARVKAHLETKLSLNIFPETCPYTLEQVLDEDFFPEG